MKAKKPLKGIVDVDEEQLLYFSPITDKVFLGKIISQDATTIAIRIFGNPADLVAVSEKKTVTFHIFRVGDAEYEFTSIIQSHEGGVLKVGVPQELIKGEEVRHPYIDVIIPAIISREQKSSRVLEDIVGENKTEKDNAKVGLPADEGMIVDEIEEEKLPCTMYKLNDYEAVVRLSQKLDFNYRYLLDFQLMDFNIRALVRIIATKTVEEAGTMYYTIKFDEMSPSSKSVLKKYVYEHL
jgi:c-di-GMP-binding flagellar brake protein YcgR